MLANIFDALSRATTARDTHGRVLSARDRVVGRGQWAGERGKGERGHAELSLQREGCNLMK